jgi:hypothetical protein
MTSTQAGKYNIVAIESPWLNANSAAFCAAKNRLATGVRGEYTSLGYAERNVDAALHRIDTFDPIFVITLEERFQSGPPELLNQTALPLLRELRHDPRFSRIPFDSTLEVIVFHRTTNSTLTTATAGPRTIHVANGRPVHVPLSAMRRAHLGARRSCDEPDVGLS